MERAVVAVTSKWYDYVTVAMAVAAVALSLLLVVSWPPQQPAIASERGQTEEGDAGVARAFGRGEAAVAAGPSPVLLVGAAGAWAAFVGMVAFKGYVRRVWTRSYFDYDVFRLLVRMRGARTRVEILRRLNEPMNRNQLAEELGMDWKTVDRHVEVLSRYGLIELVDERGRTYRLTESGRKVLELLEELARL
ncbi:MAG: winged helix-turn-helix domain-containing protein [Aigarchaeota archaeon]|nr:winged helix-turn-helix domain-containing protein [Aigarchaeota archaeon]MCS7127141.1 winged helix-turn-helix domain-containing protein [Candidatus Calditenuaceae archaeon]MCX8203392.1 winged helix-turn-helix domain-containing protein [Nitrososphaeria archaeon]MDW8043264.1 winged helix-turn-helix domain-containing protein [Nitrososphaerota archaeon]